jgi:hypothetical protein
MKIRHESHIHVISGIPEVTCHSLLGVRLRLRHTKLEDELIRKGGVMLRFWRSGVLEVTCSRALAR